MKLSLRLCKQHIGWNYKKLWSTKRAVKIQDMGVEKVLQEKGISIIKPEDILREKREFQKIDVIGYIPKPVQFDKTHPLWHDKVLLTYKDNNVLLEGLTQAKILTNTVEIQQGLPQFALPSADNYDKRVKEIILTAHLFDAEQKKLPKMKDPNRPAWNFPRGYGITQERVMKLLLSNLMQLVENYSDPSIVQTRHLVEDAHFSYNFENKDDLIQYSLKADSLLTTSNPLKSITNQNTSNCELPDIFPIDPKITLNHEHVYQIEDIYPIDLRFLKSYPHTVFVHHVDTEVGNIFEEPVSENQIFGRAFLKTFTVAASYAKERHGASTKKLPQPVTLQCVYTDGRIFHFGILQLNTLDLEDSSVRNVWYQTERIPLFDSCSYEKGRPTLKGYNGEVIQHLSAFYNNV